MAKCPKFSKGGMTPSNDPKKKTTSGAPVNGTPGTNDLAKKLTPGQWRQINERKGYERVETERPTVYALYKDPAESYVSFSGGKKIVKPYISYNAPGQSVFIDEMKKPIQFGSNTNYDPNTGMYFNPETGKEIPAIVEQYGQVNGYSLGGLTNPALNKGIGAAVNYQNDVNLANQNKVDPNSTLSGLSQNASSYGKSNSKGKSIDPNKAAMGMAAGAAAINVLNKPADTEMKYGSNEYFDNYNKGKQISQGISGVASAANPLVGGALQLLGATGDAISAADAYGVREGNDAKVALAGALSGKEALASYGRGIKDISEGKIGRGLAGFTPLGVLMANDERKLEREKLKYEQGVSENKAQFDIDKAKQEAAAKSNIQEALAARDAGVDNFQSMNYAGAAQLKDAGKFVAPEKSKTLQKLGLKNGGNVEKGVTEIITTPDGVTKYTKNSNGKVLKKENLTNAANSYSGGGKIKGYANGGEIQGKGTTKSDSIKAKVKDNSFVVPAENAPLAERLRAEILGKPTGKANVNQKGGTPVLLSNKEHLFTPKERKKLEDNGVDMYSLAPNSPYKPSMMGFATGGSVPPPKRKNSTGNASFDKTLDEISKKQYTSAKEVENDLRLLYNLQEKNTSLGGSYNIEIQNFIQGLNKAKSAVEKEEVSAKVGGEKLSDINRNADNLKKMGASQYEIDSYKNIASKSLYDGGKYYDKVASVAADKIQKGSKEQLTSELNTSAKSFYRQKQIDAIKNLELAKRNPELYTTNQINMFSEEADKANKMQSEIETAIKQGGPRLINARDVYKKDVANPSTINTKPVASTKPSTSRVVDTTAPDAKSGGINYMTGKNQPMVVNTNKSTTPSPTTSPVPKTKPAPKATAPIAGGSSTVAGSKAKAPVTPPTQEVDVTFDPNKFAFENEGDIEQKSTIPAVSQIAPDSTPVNYPVANVPEPPATIPPVVENTASKKSNVDWGSIANAAMSYGIPLAQTAIGFNQLKKAGERPVDKLDPDYLNAIDKARYNADYYANQAKFGLSPEELGQLNAQNVAETNASRFFARNLSGGNAANALNAERAAVNDSYGRNLQTRVLDTQLKRNKQDLAMNRQDSLNDMLANKQNYNRMIFGDSLNAWQQKQTAAAGLINAGLTNASDAYFANKRQADFSNIMKNSNPYQQ